MNFLRGVARRTSGLLGRDSLVINSLRPLYNFLLDCSTGRQGIRQRFNGCEEFRVDPWYRVHFPESKDPEVCAYLRQHVKPGDICLNVGAHVGIYALCLARWSAPNGKVLACEPNPRTRSVLQRHIALNRLTERVEVSHEAVAEAVGDAKFFATELAGTSRLGQPNPHIADVGNTALVVPVTTIDTLCANRDLKPDWLVLDVEGYEIHALAGARQTIRSRRGHLGIIVELHPDLWPSAGGSCHDFELLLAELALHPVPLTGQADPLSEYGIVLLQSH